MEGTAIFVCGSTAELYYKKIEDEVVVQSSKPFKTEGPRVFWTSGLPWKHIFDREAEKLKKCCFLKYGDKLARKQRRPIANVARS